jgi:hypothetical protein
MHPKCTKIECVCQQCGKTFHVPPYRIKQGPVNTCGMACQVEHRRAKNRATAQDRFWAKVDKTDTCWVWTGTVHPSGYGGLTMDGAVLYAHRVSYEWAHGPIPDGMFVCHRCDNPRCVRPDHLFAAAQLENMRDMHRKGRGQAGEKHSSAKLAREQVEAIRVRYAAGGTSHTKLAKEYGVSPITIGEILRHEIWRE